MKTQNLDLKFSFNQMIEVNGIKQKIRDRYMYKNKPLNISFDFSDGMPEFWLYALKSLPHVCSQEQLN